jgi:flagellar basal-body rod protein FlgF
VPLWARRSRAGTPFAKGPVGSLAFAMKAGPTKGGRAVIKGLWDSGAGMIARGIQQDVTGNNLANSQSTAFKEDRLNFRRMIDGSLILDRTRGVDLPENRLREGFETRMREGALQSTGAPLDFALNGPGFFVVETADGERFTRDGHFFLSPEGVLETADGLPVMGEGGLLRLGPGPVEMNGDGQLSQNGVAVGSLRVVEFEDPARLAKLGRNLWTKPEDDPDPAPAEETRLAQGMLEASNIRVVEQMVKLIEQERTYAFAHKALQMQDENLGKSVNEIGRLR